MEVLADLGHRHDDQGVLAGVLKFGKFQEKFSSFFFKRFCFGHTLVIATQNVFEECLAYWLHRLLL